MTTYVVWILMVSNYYAGTFVVDNIATERACHILGQGFAADQKPISGVAPAYSCRAVRKVKP